MYPEIKKANMPMINFPSKWQAVIFRNYGFIPIERIAKVLHTSKEIIEQEAKKLGIGVQFNAKWEKFGYITIIRNNWYLLPVNQLLELLDWTNERFVTTLKEEDFLYVKLDKFKPDCESVYYYPLSSKQEKMTEKIRALIEPFGNDEGKPFDFFSSNELHSSKHMPKSGNRIIHGYLSPCGDVFTIDSKEYLDDNLLSQYQQAGINGLWIHAVLSALSPYPFNESLSIGYEQRRTEINRLIKRCAVYGIKVYLYFNEPRAVLNNNLFDKSLMGHTTPSNEVCLCLSNGKVKDYLYQSFKGLFESLNGLGGVITITMSENLTHCLSRGITNCKNCKNVLPYEYPVLINNLIYKAIVDSNSKAELIANLWGWTAQWGFTSEMREQGLKLLNKNVSVMCVSELDKKIVKNGVESQICEYSISNVGPSDATRKILDVAKKFGHKIYAKIQVNNSWEMSAVPSIPVYDLVYEHLQNLDEIGVKNYMLSWTLGGYPSLSLQMVSAFADGKTLDEWYADTFGEVADVVHLAVKKFCEAFKNFPYSVCALYYSPKNIGYGNLWSIEQQDRAGAMIGLTFDKFEGWIYPYTLEQYLTSYRQLIDCWKSGLEVLDGVYNSRLVEKIQLYAKAALLHFKADYNQTLYSFYKREREKYKKEVNKLVLDCIQDVCTLIDICKKDATIGYEASNHYLYNIRQLKEKIINLTKINIEF